MKFNKAITLLLGVVLFAACGSNDPTGPVDPTELTFAAALNVDLAEMTRTASGLYYKDEVVGEGRLATGGSTVTVDYTGWLHTGTQFDSNVGRSPIVVERLGSANVIAGWNEGLIGMRVGGRRLLVIPSQLGYGGTRQGMIPPHSTLVFRVTMRSVGN